MRFLMMAALALGESWIRESSGMMLVASPDAGLPVDVGVWLSDGLMHVLMERGTLKRSGQVILTSRGGPVKIVVACGIRRRNDATKILLEIGVDVAANTQIALRVDVNETVTATVAVDGERTVGDVLPELFRFDRLEATPRTIVLRTDVRVVLEPRVSECPAPIKSDGDVDPSFTASRLWPAAYDLGRYLVISNVVEGKHVLELGSGSGFLGIAARHLGGASVIMTDLPENLPLIKRNVAENHLTGDVVVRSLDWTRPEPLQNIDVVLVADCVFWPKLYDPLLDTLTLFQDALILVAVTNRLDRTDRFLTRLHERGWRSVAIDPDSSASANTVIWRLER